MSRTAAVLGRALRGQAVIDARGRPGGARLELAAGSRIAAVRSVGKHLLIDFTNGLTLHSHLGMRGSWHRYRPGERWRRGPGAVAAVIQTPAVVAVCFDAPTLELLETRALSLHPRLARLGPDLLADAPDLPAAVARLRSTERGNLTVAEGLLDQTVVAGLGTVWRSEVLFIEGVDPFVLLSDLPAETSERLLRTAAGLLRTSQGGGARVTLPHASAAGPGGTTPRLTPGDRLWVYRRAGRPCRRCSAPVRSTTLGQPPRRVYWCPGCQAGQPA